jgi:penicillin amidase
MSRGLKAAAIVLGVILALVVILGVAGAVVLRQAYPKTRGTLSVPGLVAPVEIIRDDYGVPHIYAQNIDDLFFAQGYVHAQDRYWQMEFWRRIGSGRLSEYFGEATLSTDIFIRTMGFARSAEQEYASADPEVRRILDAYAAGVNAYTQSRRPAQLGLEFALLGVQGVDVQIEPWTPVNTLTWAKVMSLDLGGNYDAEVGRLDLIRQVGYDRMLEMSPRFREDYPYIVSDDELAAMGLVQSAAPPDLAYLDAVPTDLVGGWEPGQALAFGRGEGIGSNNWVISGDLTASGMPLLANDPHLGIQMPAIWYEIGLHCMPQTADCPFNVRGYSFASGPGVIVGHNDHIAWGVTNVNPDVQDLYVERLNPANINQYEVNGEWVDMEIVREEILLQGEDEPFVLLVRKTRHGPLVTDLESLAEYATVSGGAPAPQITALSLRWTALDPIRTFQSVLLLDRAQSYDDFRAALEYWDAPSQNFVFADVEGNIGYQMPGLVPIRASGDGSLPVPGWTDDYEWTGFIPYDELPRVFNPAKGYVVTANQPVVSENYPHLIMYQPDFDAGQRAARIDQMIQERAGSITAEDIQAIQGDNLNLFALEVLPYLQQISFEDPAVTAARDRLLGWDGQTHMDSPEAALYGYFWVELVQETFGDELPDNLPGSGDRAMAILHILLPDLRGAWWDDISSLQAETRDDILKRAFEQGYAAGAEALGANISAWRWGAVHTALFANQTFGESGIGPIEAIFNRGPVAASGGSSLVNNTAWRLDEPFAVVTVPSMRQIIDLGDLSASLMIHTTGQSGHPGHPHYADFIDPWRMIEYHPALWDRADVEAQARQVLRLEPAQ